MATMRSVPNLFKDDFAQWKILEPFHSGIDANNGVSHNKFISIRSYHWTHTHKALSCIDSNNGVSPTKFIYIPSIIEHTHTPKASI